MIGMGRLPSPEHFRIDSDGAVEATWFHGSQAAPSSWRATMLWQPGEGFHVYLTAGEGTFSVEGDAAGLWLAALIDFGWGRDVALDVTEWEDAELEDHAREAAEIGAALPAMPAGARASLEKIGERCQAEIDRRTAIVSSQPPGGTDR